jgi:hypothetical protein
MNREEEDPAYLLKSEDIISMMTSASLFFGLPELVTGRV